MQKKKTSVPGNIRYITLHRPLVKKKKDAKWFNLEINCDSILWSDSSKHKKWSITLVVLFEKKALLYTDDNKSTCQVVSRIPKGKHCSYFPSFLEFVGWGLVRYPVSIHWELTAYVWSSLIGGLLNIRSNSFLSLDACNDKKIEIYQQLLNVKLFGVFQLRS